MGRKQDRKKDYFQAIRDNNRQLIEQMLDEGLSMKTMDENGCSGLDIAALYGNMELVKYFIERGAKIDDAAYHCATMKGHKDIVEFFLKKELM